MVADKDRRGPMRGRYLVQSSAMFAYLTALDAVLRLGRPDRSATGRPVERVVVGICGHLGDAVLATCVLRAIHDGIPGVQIGVVVPSWGRAAFEGNPLVHWLHH